MAYKFEQCILQDIYDSYKTVDQGNNNKNTVLLVEGSCTFLSLLTRRLLATRCCTSVTKSRAGAVGRTGVMDEVTGSAVALGTAVDLLKRSISLGIAMQKLK